MELTEEMIQEFKDTAKKDGKDITDEEAKEAAWGLIRYAELIYEVASRETQLTARLRKEPDGFPVDGSYSCLVCGNGINEQTGWYHWGGSRCLLCHKAVLNGTVPQFIFKNRDSYFSIWALSRILKMKNVNIYKLVREGKLKARIVLEENGKPHEYIFLKKENPGIREAYSPARKSYDRNRDKRNRVWAREEAKKMKADMLKIRKRHTPKK
jgi:hypothetical protein